MIWFGKSVIRFCKSFIKYNKPVGTLMCSLPRIKQKMPTWHMHTHCHTGLLDLGLEAGRAVGCWHGAHTLVCYHW